MSQFGHRERLCLVPCNILDSCSKVHLRDLRLWVLFFYFLRQGHILLLRLALNDYAAQTCLKRMVFLMSPLE